MKFNMALGSGNIAVSDKVKLELDISSSFTDRSVGEIAWQTGFGDPLYFSRAFKRHTGEPPTVYRDRTRGVARD